MSAPLVVQPPLPPGWTEHRAPSGHSYYYNAETKQSTYTRPEPPVASENAADPGFYVQADYISLGDFAPEPVSSLPQTFEHRPRQPRREPKDWPRSKHKIPRCAPWLLINTRLRRRFVHNPETGESYWKFPEHVATAVVQYDIHLAQRAGRRARGEPSPERSPSEEAPPRNTVELKSAGASFGVVDGGTTEQRDALRTTENEASAVGQDDGEEEEYDEIIEEIVEDEDEDQENEENGASPQKRQRTEERDPAQDQTLEFGEDDMAWQLEQMGQAYDLAPGEYGVERVDNGLDEQDQGLEMTDEDVAASFEDMLDDFKVSPYSTWDSVVEDGRVIDDPRYTLYPSTKARREAFATWSARKIEENKATRERQGRQDPKIPYLALLDKHATAKLYWPEFKRKYRKQPEMKDLALSDKDREKLYRDHIHRITKMHERDLEDDLWGLLKTIPASSHWHRGVTVEGTLPEQLLGDIRFISLKPKMRETLLKDFIQRKLPEPQDVEDDAEDKDARGQQQADRAKRDQALRDRQRQVEADKRRQERDIRGGRQRLDEGEQELRHATR